MSNPMNELDKAKLTAEQLADEWTAAHGLSNAQADLLLLGILNALISVADSLALRGSKAAEALTWS